jgi:hypothetical protein
MTNSNLEIKKITFIIITSKWMDQENIILSEVSQAQKAIGLET